MGIVKAVEEHVDGEEEDNVFAKVDARGKAENLCIGKM
jgi:hypothetical protein